jgi:hypothetical protein
LEGQDATLRIARLQLFVGTIGLHRDFGRHPVIVAAREIFIPRPLPQAFSTASSAIALL